MTDQETKTIAIKDIVVDDDLYPRSKWSWLTSYDYSKSMETGAIFPDIIVADFEGTLILVDGKHRIEALRMLKQTNVRATILKGLTKKDILLKSIETNIANGRPLSPYEKTDLVLRLQDLNISIDQISEIIQIPASNIKTMMLKKVTHTVENKPLSLKAPFRHLSSGVVTEGDLEEWQKDFNVAGQITVIDQLLVLVENDLLNLKDHHINSKFNQLLEVLQQKFSKVAKGATKKTTKATKKTKTKKTKKK